MDTDKKRTGVKIPTIGIGTFEPIATGMPYHLYAITSGADGIAYHAFAYGKRGAHKEPVGSRFGIDGFLVNTTDRVLSGGVVHIVGPDGARSVVFSTDEDKTPAWRNLPATPRAALELWVPALLQRYRDAQKDLVRYDLYPNDLEGGKSVAWDRWEGVLPQEHIAQQLEKERAMLQWNASFGGPCASWPKGSAFPHLGGRISVFGR